MTGAGPFANWPYNEKLLRHAVFIQDLDTDIVRVEVSRAALEAAGESVGYEKGPPIPSQAECLRVSDAGIWDFGILDKAITPRLSSCRSSL